MMPSTMSEIQKITCGSCSQHAQRMAPEPHEDHEVDHDERRRGWRAMKPHTSQRV